MTVQTNAPLSFIAIPALYLLLAIGCCRIEAKTKNVSARLLLTYPKVGDVNQP